MLWIQQLSSAFKIREQTHNICKTSDFKMQNVRARTKYILRFCCMKFINVNSNINKILLFYCECQGLSVRNKLLRGNPRLWFASESLWSQCRVASFWLSKGNAGMQRQQGEGDKLVEQKVNSSIDFGFLTGYKPEKAWSVDEFLHYKSFKYRSTNSQML